MVLPHLILAVGIHKSKSGSIKSLTDVLADILDDLHRTVEHDVDVGFERFGKQQTGDTTTCC